MRLATFPSLMRSLILIVALALVTAACSGPVAKSASSETEVKSGGSTSTTTTVASSTTTTSLSTENTSAWPLTGRPSDDVIDVPIIAAKVDQTAAGRPQAGLDSADLVFEVLVEGGVPRLIAMFQSSVPEVVGPIRSLREVDPKLVAPFGVLFANSGGDAPIRALLTGVARDVGDPLLGSIAYFRASDRSAPYNLMLTTSGLAGQEPDEPSTSDWLTFGDPVGEGEQALTVEISMSAAHQAIYRWSSADEAFLRFNGERPHLAASEEQIMAQNVVVVFARQFDTGRRDRAGSVVPDYDVTGSGDAIVFRDGMGFPGTWERGSVDGFFRFFDADGNLIPLAQGTTWVQIVPIGRTVVWQ